MQSLAAPVEDEDESNEQDAPDKPKKKKAKKDPLFSKKTKSDPNAPPLDRIPFPDLYVTIKQVCINFCAKITSKTTMDEELSFVIHSSNNNEGFDVFSKICNN